MTHARLSPSGSKRWMNCPGSSALIASQLASGEIKESTSRFASEGTVAHEIGEECLKGLTELELTLGQVRKADGLSFTVTDEMIRAVRVYIDYVYEYFVNTSDEMLVEQRCSLTPLGIPGLDGGTSDAIIIDRVDKILHVFDYKHGAGVKVYAEENEQGMQYALGALMDLEQRMGDEFKLDEWQVRIHIIQPRADWDRPTSKWEISASDLYEWCREILIPTAKAANQPDAKLIPGDSQCRWCNANCPKLYEITQQQAMIDFDIDDEPELAKPEHLTVHQRAQVVLHASKIRNFLKTVEENVKLEILHGSQDYSTYLKPVKGRSTRVLKDEASDPDFSPLLDIVQHEEVFAFKTKTLSEIENAVKLQYKKQGKKAPAKLAKEYVTSLCDKKEGSIALAPLSDKRAAVEIEGDFDNLIETENVDI